MYQITMPYDLDGITLSITADITLGEPMSYDSPGYGDTIEEVRISGTRKSMGKDWQYNLPSEFVEEMREKWDIDDLIHDELKKRERAARRVS